VSGRFFYIATKTRFLRDLQAGVIADKLVEAIGHRVSDSEKSSWNNSLMYFGMAISPTSIPDDTGVALELNIPQTSKRIDVVLSGSNDENQRNAVIIELKQWSSATSTGKDGIVNTILGRGLRDVPHPSYQAWSYASLLTDFNEAVYTSDIELRPCAYLHNYGSTTCLWDEQYAEWVQKAPVFGKTGMQELRDFISKFIRFGDAGDLILEIHNGRIRPSKHLADKVASMLDGNPEFVLVDDQKVAFETIRQRASKAEERKQVVIVEGGPGTGKSVVAINLLASFLQDGRFASYVTKNSAPREVYAAKLANTFRKTAINNLFLNSGKFTGTAPDTYNVLLVDEAHRLNEKSGLYGNLGEHQVKEIISATRTSVFFVDEDQRVTLKDIGRKDVIREFARDFDAEITELSLSSQFRCNGQDGYLAWVDDVLQIRETANPTLAGIDFDFQVFSSPAELFDAVSEKNGDSNKSRVVAGYCWPWKSKKESSAFDIEFPTFGFHKQWNLTDDGMLWLIKPESIDQIGCIHTCQGLELEYVGVIIGDDLVVRNGEVVCQPEARATHDSSVRGWKKMMRENPAETRPLLDMVIKNTYRTLMTRGMKGCYVYSTDEETQWYLRGRV